MSVASTSTSTDPWDQPFQAPVPARRIIQTQAIPDDWENDDEDEGAEEDQQKVWEDANRKAPMPELVISGSSTASVVPPPPAAFQPTLRILKRPTASSSNSAASAAPQDTQKSYAEREAQYQAARERIFSKEGARTPAGRRDSAEDDGAQASTRAMNGRALASPSPADAIGVKVIRGPRGPSALPGDDSQASSADVLPPRGFVGRRGKGNPRS